MTNEKLKNEKEYAALADDLIKANQELTKVTAQLKTYKRFSNYSTILLLDFVGNFTNKDKLNFRIIQFVEKVQKYEGTEKLGLVELLKLKQEQLANDILYKNS